MAKGGLVMATEGLGIAFYGQGGLGNGLVMPRAALVMAWPVKRSYAMTRHRNEWLWQQNQIKPPSVQCPWGLDDPSGGEAFSYIFNSFACALPPSEHSHAQRPHHHHTRPFFANVSSSDLSSLLPFFLSSDKRHRF